MRKALFKKLRWVCPGIKPAILRYFFRDLTGDSSTSRDFQEAEIEEWVHEIINIEPEDPNTIIDSREVTKVEVSLSVSLILKVSWSVFGKG